ncbi:HNH endonuclease [Microbacterium sp. NPDC087591]|uniref:HNH endonuclease n=1 Tax=Microbacterium sp. NPDC087591 TaxID=3364192 RepID=UPI0037F9AECD
MAISERTRKLLWTRAHDQCAFPGCLQALTLDVNNAQTGGSDVVVLGQEAHIRARSAGGPRYDVDYAEVDGYENLVLMCPTHHSLIDANDGTGYSVDVLVAMKARHERNQQRRDALQTTLRAYLGDRYAAEDTVQFQQVDLRGPSVDSMFVDVPVGCRRDESAVSDLLIRISDAAPGDTAELEAASGFVITGATQALLHPEWKGNAVLVGGPGQGKSTVLQYVCQFHRARRLGENAYTADQSGLVRATSIARFPIRIDLRKYAQWAVNVPPARRGKTRKSKERSRRDDDWRSLEEFVIDDIGRHIGAHQFEARDFAVLIATEPVLLALDGLDEVASLSVRAKVVDEIARVRGRLSPDAADLVILVATRPGSSLQPLTSSGAFPVLHLQRLTQGLRLQYLQRWVAVSQLSPEAATRLQSTFMDSQHVPHISELASYPMQLAILLHLLHRRQLLPQQRTELYAEYLKTFLDREQTEDKEPLLAEQRRVVEDTHAYLGWHLQAKAEQGQSSGKISRDELRQLLRNYLAGQPEEQKLAEELYSAITDRVLCLVERDDAFEFEVQSLREYFAALHIFDNLTAKGIGNSRDDGLNALLERPYWSNVCRFFIGMLTKGEVRALRDNFRTVGKRVSPQPTIRSMAVLVLGDRIFHGLIDTEIREVVDFVLEGPGVILAEDGAFDSAGTPLRLGDRAGRSQAVAHLKGRLEQEKSPEIRHAIARSLDAHAMPDDDIASWWWERFEATTAWLQTAADLRALPQPDPRRLDQLHSIVAEADGEHDWLVDILAEGGYNGQDEQILNRARSDLNEGAAEGATHRVETSPLTDLINAATTTLSNPRRKLPTPALPPRPGPKHTATGSTAANAVTPSTSTTIDWDQHLATIADAWGDGWILRRVVATVPTDVDLSAVAARARTAALTEAAGIEASYRQNRGDAAWWRTHLAALTSPRDKMLAVIGILEQARTSVVIELSTAIDDLVQTFDSKRYRAVELSLQRDAAGHRVRSLDLQDALRLQQVNFSGRTLWLIWTIGTESTRERVAIRLEPTLRDLLVAGTSDARTAVIAACKTRKQKLEIFKGSRYALPPGGWANQARLASITPSVAKSILEDPGEWPADLVQIATDKLAARRAERTPALAETAASNRWFRDTD